MGVLWAVWRVVMAGRFIKLTENTQRHQGECWINVDAIREVSPYKDGGILHFTKDDFIYVKETASQIIALINQANR